jgi:exopolysaccharide biosynthesis WecB/TagA/CpsF family protein
MRVAHVIPQFHPGIGGIETHVLELARQQRIAGVNAEVITLDRLRTKPGLRLSGYDSVQGVPVRRIGYVGWSGYPLPVGLLGSIDPFDIVHVHGAGSLSHYLAAARFFHRKPLVITTYGLGLSTDKPLQLLRTHVAVRLLLSVFARVFAGDAREMALLPVRANARRLQADYAADPAVLVREYENITGSRERQILGVAVRSLTRRQAISRIDAAIDTGQHLNVGFANAHSLNLASINEEYRKALQEFLVLNDGLGLDIASRIKFGRPFEANLNGTDFTPDFLARTRHNLRIYMVGTTDAVVERAARKFQARYPQHTIVGYRNGFFSGAEDAEETCRKIRSLEADCVLVGMGNPLQELWIADYGPKTGAGLLFGVGALFDFEAARVPRAPVWVRKLRCEWVYRLLQEPRRLVRRYLIGNAVFLGRVIADARK